MYLLCLFCYDCFICFGVFLLCVTSGWIHSGIEVSMGQFCYANSLLTDNYYFWNVKFFAAYQLAIHIARHPGSWRWEGNTAGMWLWAPAQDFCFEESHVSSTKSDRAKFIENEQKRELMSSYFSEPILTKDVFMWAPLLTRKASWADYANISLSAVFDLCGVKILVIWVQWSHKSEPQDMETAPDIQPLKGYLRCCAPSDSNWII